MSEKWKSLPRKYCEVCKCWFGDNKASLAHHESGQNHKDNTAKYLKEVRARSAKKNQEEALAKKFFSKVDEKALESYQKDVESGIAKPLKYTPTSKKEKSDGDTKDKTSDSTSRSKIRSRKPSQSRPKVEKKSDSSVQIPPAKKLKSDSDARPQPYGQWVPVAETTEKGTETRNETQLPPPIEPLRFTERTMDSSLSLLPTQAGSKVEFNKPAGTKVKRRNFRRTTDED